MCVLLHIGFHYESGSDAATLGEQIMYFAHQTSNCPDVDQTGSDIIVAKTRRPENSVVRNFRDVGETSHQARVLPSGDTG